MTDAPLRNGILRALPAEDLRILLPLCRREKMRLGQIVEPRDGAIDTVLFPVSGVASVVATGERDKRMETGPIGWEGMTGLPVVHGVGRSPTETVVQVEGEAIAAPASEIDALQRRSAAARSVFLRYSYAFGLQVVQTALSANLSSVERRLARWLLMLHDRVDDAEMKITHEFMAMMLGARRPGVTEAMHVLEGHRLVKANRGRVVVVDRPGLEAFAGAIYGVPEREYRRVLGVGRSDGAFGGHLDGAGAHPPAVLP